MKKRIKRLAITAVISAGLIVGTNTSPASAAASPQVVTSGLNNPRQLSLTSDGVLMVAEAGKGGTTCIGEFESTCIGLTGSITAVTDPATSNNVAPNRVVKNLLSIADRDGSFAVGSDGVSMRRYQGGTMFIQETYGPPESFPGNLGAQSGKLLYVNPHLTPKVASDVAKYELTKDPDKHGPDSNPYAVLDLGDRRLVADAAGNSILQVDRDGSITLFHVFPNIRTAKECGKPNPIAGWPGFDPTPEFPGCNFVPTSMAVKADGDILVGGLASEQAGQGQVVEIDGTTGAFEAVWTGFTTVTGVAVGKDGAMYVSQLFAPQANPVDPQVSGVVTKVATNGTRTSVDVPFPAGIAVDGSNNVYVAAYSIGPEGGFPNAPPMLNTSGQIWRFTF